MSEFPKQQIENAINLLVAFSASEENVKRIKDVSQKLAAVFEAGNKVLICGNGGSAADAMHFAEELTGRFKNDRRALPAIALTDPTHITCVGNDYGFEYIFSRGVEAYGKPGDMFIGLSSSGNSQNVINAMQEAKKNGLVTVALLGKDGGKLKNKADYQWIIPAHTTDRIQEIHMMILHLLVEGVENVLFN